MDKSVATDLTSQVTSERADSALPGPHDFELCVRVPVLNATLKLTSKSPANTPGDAALAVLALSCAAQIGPAIFALLSVLSPAPWWVVTIAALTSGLTMIGATRLMCWYQQREHGRHRDLGEAPGDRADLLIAQEPRPAMSHELELARRGSPWAKLAVNSSARSMLALSMALVILAVATLISAGSLIGLGMLVAAPGLSTAVSALTAGATTTACGAFLLIHVEQMEPEGPTASPVPDAPTPAEEGNQ